MCLKLATWKTGRKVEDLVDPKEVDNGMKGELNWSRFVSYGGFEIINVLLP
jgi:hypothetical protein